VKTATAELRQIDPDLLQQLCRLSFSAAGSVFAQSCNWQIDCCARCEWKYKRSTAKKRDEIPPTHCLPETSTLHRSGPSILVVPTRLGKASDGATFTPGWDSLYVGGYDDRWPPSALWNVVVLSRKRLEACLSLDRNPG
jgi:hypothetical protein